jgi:hypothetical protein
LSFVCVDANLTRYAWFMNRFATRDRILQLDPEKDTLQILQLSVFYDFPWDFNRSLELALYKTFAVPGIAKILDRSAEFEKHPQKRYDDTDLLLSEIIEYGYDSPRGKSAIEHMNWIHSHYAISNEDYRYVLSTFIFEPARWIRKFGWRPLTRNEELAGLKFWKEVGKRMGIQEIPATIEEFEAFNVAYERAHFQYTPSNRRVAEATENLMLSWFLPKALWDTGRPFIHGIMDEHLLRAFGYAEAAEPVKFIAINALRLRSKAMNLLPGRITPYLRTTDRKSTYPRGYVLSDLGPDRLHRKTACPYHAVREAMGAHVA